MQNYKIPKSAAVSASTLLPDSINQEPLGLARLLERERQHDKFDLFAIAEEVDQQMEEYTAGRGNRAPLIDRLEAHMTSQLQQTVTDSIEIEKRVGNYTLEKVIGTGAMGVVYKARHDMLKRPAAVKMIHADQLSDHSIGRFEEEVQLTSQLEHPNTISIYDYGRTPEGVFFYAMEFVDGITLKQLVQLYGAQPAGRVVHLLTQICGSLAEAHQLGVIHRDIKPENVLVSIRGGMCDVVKVFDFGLSKHLDSNQEQKQNGLSGTPLYLAPESIDPNQPVDHRSDIYSVGALGYYLLTGETVFTGNGIVDICMQQVNAQPVTPSKRLGKPIEAELEELVLQCLKKSPDERPGSSDQLAINLLQTPSAGKWDQIQARQWWDTYSNQKEKGELAVQELAAHAEEGFDLSTPTIITTEALVLT